MLDRPHGVLKRQRRRGFASSVWPRRLALDRPASKLNSHAEAEISPNKDARRPRFPAALPAVADRHAGRAAGRARVVLMASPLYDAEHWATALKRRALWRIK